MAGRNAELMKNTAILSIGQILPKLIAIFVLPLLTTYLTKKDFGLYELTLSVASFCIPLLSVQIQQGVFRFLLDKDSDKQSLITTSFIFVVGVFTISSFPIVLSWWIYSKDFVLAVLFFGSYFAEVLLTWAGQATRGLGDNIRYSLAYIIYSSTFIAILAIMLFVYSALDAKSVAFSMICAYVVSFLFLIFKANILKCYKMSSISQNTLRILLSYSAPMVISSVALWIVNLSDRLFVSGILGIEMTAVYSVANKIPNLFNSVYNIFNLAWTENTSKLTEYEKKGEYYSIFFKDFYRVMDGMMLMLISFSPFLFKVLINSQYSNGYWLMSWLFIGVFFSSLVSFFGSIYVGEKRTKDVGVSSAVGAIINVVINALFMNRFGVIVAAISTIISYFIICIYRAHDIKKYVVIKYDYFSLGFGLVILIIVALLNNSFSFIRTVASIIITIVYNLCFNRSFLIGLIRKIISIIGGK